MAGAGKRFADAGYALPKPLIPIDGAPMVVRAGESLPEADAWIFVCRSEHLGHSDMENVLRERFPDVQLIRVDQLTEGQASTCMLAAPYLREADVLHIGPCDSATVHTRSDPFATHPEADVLVWTVRGNPLVTARPQMYGWVEVEDAGVLVSRVSVKVPLSEQPMRDHAIVGAFSFRRASDFITSTAAMITAGRRINGEYYMDEVMNVAIERGLRVEAFEVDTYIGWGTPQDLEAYQARRKSVDMTR